MELSKEETELMIYVLDEKVEEINIKESVHTDPALWNEHKSMGDLLSKLIEHLCTFPE